MRATVCYFCDSFEGSAGSRWAAAVKAETLLSQKRSMPLRFSLFLARLYVSLDGLPHARCQHRLQKNHRTKSGRPHGGLLLPLVAVDPEDF